MTETSTLITEGTRIEEDSGVMSRSSRHRIPQDLTSILPPIPRVPYGISNRKFLLERSPRSHLSLYRTCLTNGLSVTPAERCPPVRGEVHRPVLRGTRSCIQFGARRYGGDFENNSFGKSGGEILDGGF